MFALEGYYSSELRIKLLRLRPLTRTQAAYVWVSVSVCVRRAHAQYRRSRRKAIKVAEMASQGADTIPIGYTGSA